MGIDSGIYKFTLVLHILCAIVGFGAVFLNGIYGAQVRARPGPEGLAIFQANILVSKIGEYFIYAVFFLGFALVGLSDGVIDFDETWVFLSIVLFVVGIGLSHGMLQPTVRKMEGLMQEMVSARPPPAGAAGPPPQAAQLAELGKRLPPLDLALKAVLIAILFLMVWQPGR